MPAPDLTPTAFFNPDPPMKLNVAVQMDPIARINIRGDSTFALLLEAQKRGHTISYYTPDKLSLLGTEVVAPVQLLSVRDQEGDHFTLGEARRESLAAFDVVLLRHHVDAFSGTHPSEHAGGQQSGERAQRPGKTVCDEFSGADAADTDLARSR
jgi:glutathione synthase/RimK-type ligase-like ATP-grasp enzyme